MMKVFFLLIFMVPLSFLKSGFWIFQYIFFIFTFVFYSLYNCSNMFYYISYFWGIDMLSFVMILLSFWICSLMIMASENLLKYNYYSYIFLFIILLLLFSLYCTFSSMNLFVFYLFFEMSLIPTLILIVGWGYQPERIQAGIYLMFYTLFASLPMMLSIFYYYLIYGSLDYYYFFKGVDLILFYFCINLVFFVKMPMYLVHLWLPKAHVEAPVSGSMILAGVMLKLGGYGLMRLMSLVISVAVKVNFNFILISLVGGLLVSLICLRQSDMKSLVAYSSVAHMGLVLGGIMTVSYWGLCGSLVMMIAHGLCSSGLFCLVNISYERLLSRSLYLNKGLINIMPGMTLWWFLLCSSNMAAPPSFNLLGEIMLINSLVSWSWISMIMLSMISFFSAAYSLHLYAYSQHGKISSGSFSMSGGLVREYLLMFLHWFPLNIMIMKATDFMNWL
uniref:NADH-ubiquinone oxidoreductase chain 4 n=1 Tax=Himaloaesalus gaoligongshanus TaxID=2583518 RepID=A0A7L4VS83_9SCAR|nr:NADH dehydrogenase subunit 4 [Himaloaesalus gaoligongshanus]QCU46387.1 NADH dehydrogenase subunit 4 [Himaloaesalus gaoligongshanus]WQF69242.1 NADH dehydrogenase subunit 4 [Himaloaesalus gaoligongshanus]